MHGHWVWTTPHTSTSSTRCITRCVITSKKEGGISISNMHKVVATSSLNIGISLGFMAFPHIYWNTILNHIISFGMFSCMNPLKHKGNNYCMTTCQSCAFMLDHSRSTNVLPMMWSSRMVPLGMQISFGKWRVPSHLAHSWHVASSIMLDFVGFG